MSLLDRLGGSRSKQPWIPNFVHSSAPFQRRKASNVCFQSSAAGPTFSRKRSRSH